MIDMNAVSIKSVNWAAQQIRERLPKPTTRVADLPLAESEAFFKALAELLEDYIGIIGALRSGERAWLDVQLASGRWSGRWFDECASEAAIDVAYWFDEPIISAGVGIRASAEAAEAREARLAAGDLLVLLGDDW